MDTFELLEKGKPLSQASRALILLHGRGGSSEDILTLSDHFCDNSFYIAAPQASKNSWYPYSFLKEESLNEPQLSTSIEFLKNLIEIIVRKIPQEKVFVMGFSQGACMALEVTSRHATKYGGIVAFTGGLIGQTVNKTKYQGNFQKTKVFISDGDEDPHVPAERCRESKEIMSQLNADVTLMIDKRSSHTITTKEIDWVKNNMMRF